MRVKICGITGERDRDAAVAAGADALGFVSGVPVETPRELSTDAAAGLIDGVPPFVTGVLVTGYDGVDETVTRQRRVGADIVQVHGDTTPAAVGELRERVRAGVVVAVDGDTDRAAEYAAAADGLLVDSTTETGMGGTGETHDWKRTRGLVSTVDAPVILAGGLTPENVRAAVETARPFGVDVASGVERRLGRKNTDAVRRFVTAATEGSP